MRGKYCTPGYPAANCQTLFDLNLYATVLQTVYLPFKSTVAAHHYRARKNAGGTLICIALKLLP
jgi:hypothetical protein